MNMICVEYYLQSLHVWIIIYNHYLQLHIVEQYT